MVPVLVLERVVRRAPLGLRFLDLVREAPVTDGLAVVAWPTGADQPGQLATRSPLSGVYGFRTLPGLRDYELGERPARDWCGAAASGVPTAEGLLDLDALRALLRADVGRRQANFVVRARDQSGRFLPVVLRLCLPREEIVEVPLFSAPTRPPPPGMAVVRGELRLRAGRRNSPRRLPGPPAAWALVAATADGATTYLTVADARGMFSLFLPYAGTLPPLVGSPPHGSAPIDQLSWPLTLRVFYERRRQRPVPGLEPADPPDVRSILEQDAAALHDVPGVFGPTLVRPLRLGMALVVATQGRSDLLIEPG